MQALELVGAHPPPCFDLVIIKKDSLLTQRGSATSIAGDTWVERRLSALMNNDDDQHDDDEDDDDDEDENDEDDEDDENDEDDEDVDDVDDGDEDDEDDDNDDVDDDNNYGVLNDDNYHCGFFFFQY